MSIDYVSKNLGCEGEEQERIFRQEGVRKGFQVKGKEVWWGREMQVRWRN